MVDLFAGFPVTDYDRVSGRGIEALRSEHYESGMRKIVYQDPDGNELSFGGISPK